MSSRILQINTKPIQHNPTNTFLIRYSDINKKKQKTLAERIKLTTPYKRISHNPLITQKHIHQLLQEINPIIFKEGNSLSNTYKTFNGSRTMQLSGWHFKELCEIIYNILYEKNENILTQKRIITRSTYGTSEQITRERNQIIKKNTKQLADETISTAEIGLTEIRQAGRTSPTLEND